LWDTKFLKPEVLAIAYYGTLTDAFELFNYIFLRNELLLSWKDIYSWYLMLFMDFYGILRHSNSSSPLLVVEIVSKAILPE
jgi:hypothetical protein